MKLIHFLAAVCLITSVAIPASSSAQEPEVRRDARGVIHVQPVHVEGRRQRPVAVLVPRSARVVGAMNAPSTSFVRRVVRSVRSEAF